MPADVHDQPDGAQHLEDLVLAVTSEQPGRSMRLSELAALANGSLSRLSRVATRLERRGLLARRVDPDDGRFTQKVLTDAGLALVVEAAPGHVDCVRRAVFDRLGPAQLRHLHGLTGRLLDGIDEVDPDPPRMTGLREPLLRD